MKVTTQPCPTLCNPIDYTVHGILQARILEWVAFPFSRGSSQPRDWTQVSCIADGFLSAEPQGKPKNTGMGSLSVLQRIFLTQELNRVSALQADSLPTELSNLWSVTLPWFKPPFRIPCHFTPPLPTMSASAQERTGARHHITFTCSMFMLTSYLFKEHFISNCDIKALWLLLGISGRASIERKWGRRMSSQSPERVPQRPDPLVYTHVGTPCPSLSRMSQSGFCFNLALVLSPLPSLDHPLLLWEVLPSSQLWTGWLSRATYAAYTSQAVQQQRICLPMHAGDAGDLSSIPGSERFPRGGEGSPLQHSCLENPVDWGAWWATGHGVAESDRAEHACTHTLVHVVEKPKTLDCVTSRTLPTRDTPEVHDKAEWFVSSQEYLPRPSPISSSPPAPSPSAHYPHWGPYSDPFISQGLVLLDSADVWT